MYIKATVKIFFLLSMVFGHGQDEHAFFSKADIFFNTYVDKGRVDYKSIVEDRSELDVLLTLANEMRVSRENETTYQAFWINGYNLLVIKSIVDVYPIKSPMDKAGFFEEKIHKIGGKEITLNDIEHKMLRGVFPKEPRFHFVLVCAGLGCPPIISKAYMPNTLDIQLETQTSLALNDSEFIQLHKNKVKISQIFEWYKGDFTQSGKNLIYYINQYRTVKLPEKTKVSYYPYNWALNEIK